MDTKNLKLFLHLSESLHFGQTGEAMHMSASAVSRTIQRMEEEVGQRLLERDNRSVRLTEAGRRLQVFARQTLAQWQQLSESLSRDAQTLADYFAGLNELRCPLGDHDREEANAPHGPAIVAPPDLGRILAAWGACDGCPEDLGGSGAVDFEDLLEVRAALADG